MKSASAVSDDAPTVCARERRPPRAGVAHALPWAAAAASGLLLAVAYPPLEWSALAWMALVPLLLAVRHAEPRRAAAAGLFFGLLFWHVSLSWLQRVTTVGWIALSVYCALYPAVFCALYAAWRCTAARHLPGTGGRVATMAIAALVWTGLEYLRSVLFTGFPWNGLGVSQFQQVLLIQSAAWGGVFAVSALVVWVNAGIALTVERWFDRRGASPRIAPEMMVAVAAVVAALGYGRSQIRRLPPADRTVRLALIQPAIPQYVKWTEAFVEETYRRLASLSQAARYGQPDLLVWPETAIADVLRASPEGYALARSVATSGGAPLLLGALDEKIEDDGRILHYNSAFLLGTGGTIDWVYDKRHLVLFGEYVPFSDRFPFLRSLTPIDGDITPGDTPGVGHEPSSDLRFGVLICFEDTVPNLSRDLAAGGAQVLITLTNDAWFDFSSGSRQHVAQSVFRSVEQRRPMARSANSGITVWIDAAGRLGGAEGEGGILPHYGEGPTALAGFLIAEIPVWEEPPPATFYARRGDVFGSGSAWFLLPLSIGLLALRRRRMKQ